MSFKDACAAPQQSYINSVRLEKKTTKKKQQQKTKKKKNKTKNKQNKKTTIHKYIEPIYA